MADLVSKHICDRVSEGSSSNPLAETPPHILWLEWKMFHVTEKSIHFTHLYVIELKSMLNQKSNKISTERSV